MRRLLTPTKSLLIAGLVLLAATLAWGQAVLDGYQEQLRVEIVNEAGGLVRASRDQGQSWMELGQVLKAAEKVDPQGYRASAWVGDSSVAATAVNALHLKIANHPESGRGIIFSIIPRGKVATAAGAESSIIMDMQAGQGLFGGLGPTVGSPVCGWSEDQWRPLPPDYCPQRGDHLLLLRIVPQHQIRYLDLENIFGGRITATYADGSQELIGQVLRPVTGLGRFEGTRYADCGRIRANHAGVLDISTSPYGQVGGFQIIPWDHANDSEMYYVRTNHQWMVVGPVDRREGAWKAQPPLFWGHVYPSYRRDDLQHDDWIDRLLSRALVLGRRGEGDWELLPRIAFSKQAPLDSAPPPEGKIWLIYEPASIYKPLPAVAQKVLMEITAFRLVLPREIFWPESEEN